MKNIKVILKGVLLYTTILLVILTITIIDSNNGMLEVYLLILSGVGILACYIHLNQEDINKLLFKDKLFEE